MANGLSLGLLQMQKEVSGSATPQYKVEPTGFYESLITAHSPASIKNDSYNGHKKTVKIKAKQRALKTETQDSPSCDTTYTAPIAEQEVSIANYVQRAIHLEEETVAAMDEYASANAAIPGSTQASGILWELYDSILTQANALISSMNEGLVTLAIANLGDHRATGNATAVDINIALNTTNNPLNNGLAKLFGDFRYNNMTGRPIAVGGGLFHNFMLQQNAKGIDQSGVNTRIQTSGIDFYYDNDVAGVGGSANHILVYEKDAVQIVQYMVNQGFKAGAKPGRSTFGVMTLFTQTGIPVKFDYQLMFNDCEQEMAYVDDTPAVTVQRGYNLILSKHYGLYALPSTAYKVGDPLEGNRGSLRYNITNV